MGGWGSCPEQRVCVCVCVCVRMCVCVCVCVCVFDVTPMRSSWRLRDWGTCWLLQRERCSVCVCLCVCVSVCLCVCVSVCVCVCVCVCGCVCVHCQLCFISSTKITQGSMMK